MQKGGTGGSRGYPWVSGGFRGWGAGRATAPVKVPMATGRLETRGRIDECALMTLVLIMVALALGFGASLQLNLARIVVPP